MASRLGDRLHRPRSNKGGRFLRPASSQSSRSALLHTHAPAKRRDHPEQDVPSQQGLHALIHFT